MKVKALVDVLVNYKRYAAGSEFDVDAETGRVLLKNGWATEIKVKKTETAAKPSKKK